MRRMLIALAIGMFVFLVAKAASGYTENPTLNQVVSRLAGRDVSVHCLTRKETKQDFVITYWGALAYVTYDVHTGQSASFTIASSEVCAPLLRFLKDGVWNVSPKKMALSILVITHESYHMRAEKPDNGEKDEAVTECWAVRHIRYVALFLGFTKEQSYQLRDLGLDWDVQHNKDFPEYDLKTCKRPVRGSR